jgi:hypothetical protein
MRTRHCRRRKCPAWILAMDVLQERRKALVERIDLEIADTITLKAEATMAKAEEKEER